MNLAKELNKRLETEGQDLDVIVPVIISAEESKYGHHPVEFELFVQWLEEFPHLRSHDLITLDLFRADIDRVRTYFWLLRHLLSRAVSVAHPSRAFQWASLAIIKRQLKRMQMSSFWKAIFGPVPETMPLSGQAKSLTINP